MKTQATADQVLALGPVLDFLRMLWAMDHALNRRSKHMLAKLGVTGPQRLVLRIIGSSPEATAGQLAQIMHLHPGTLSGILRRLEKKLMIIRSTDPHDGRRAFLSLTAIGRDYNDNSKETIEFVIASALAELPDEQVSMTKNVLAHIVGKITENSES
jgi:MarR family transcriptional regulator, organic hydroperoxide resistance regulator